MRDRAKRKNVGESKCNRQGYEDEALHATPERNIQLWIGILTETSAQKIRVLTAIDNNLSSKFIGIVNDYKYCKDVVKRGLSHDL